VHRLQTNGSFLIMGSGPLNVNPGLAASEPAIVTSFTGLPFVAWIEGSGAQQNIYVKRLSLGVGMGVNLDWRSVAATDAPLNYSPGSRASSPSIALDAELQPMVAWIEDGAAKFKRFDGTAWVAASGGDGPASSGADRVRLNSNVTGLPVLAWTQGAGMARALKVVRDLAFTPLGTQVNPASLNTVTEFAVLGEGAGAIVTWSDQGLNFTVRSQRWDGTSWVNVRSNQVINNNPNRLVGLAMPRNALAVVVTSTFADVNIDIANMNTFDGSGVVINNWLVETTSYVTTRDNDIGPVAMEYAPSTTPSPVVIVVSKNALGEYQWHTLRYYRP
jgi:hypothetical protein